MKVTLTNYTPNPLKTIAEATAKAMNKSTKPMFGKHRLKPEDFSNNPIIDHLYVRPDLKHYTVSDIKEHIKNGNTTIVKFKDGEQSIVVCSPEDHYSREIGIALALFRANFKNKKHKKIWQKMTTSE